MTPIRIKCSRKTQIRHKCA